MRARTASRRSRKIGSIDFSDSGSFMLGSHEFQFGGSLQAIRVNPYNYAGRYPTVSTGFSAGVDREAARQAGIAELLLKPLTIEDLESAIRKVLSQKVQESSPC
jgi:hypothetical protein